ncbi:methyltransferase domain-containing protein [Flavobacteriaceae bacterium S356]|uniref:Methyltransferase domain-containing protein n=1 Tax=Asprobacillus argus TaxID=3076534 RepID=A0ABU3LEV2_9FLAO|nr:methyltransferase domain-containing protein [Flavobacteriaceae bacterium S356]
MEITTTFEIKKESQRISIEGKISDFYDKATEDYRFWSKDLNMHFGYYIPFKTNFLKRDTMLNAMNAHLFSLLDIQNKKSHVVDLGCGMGATMKYGISRSPNLAVTGYTISEFQVKFGHKFLNSERASIMNADYRNTKALDSSYDGALAIESFCHSGCSIKALKESHRILKSGANLVIADAFGKKSKDEMNFLSQKVYDGLCKSWNLKKLGNIEKVKVQLEEIGFKDVSVKNVWYRVAPSVLHVPFAIMGFVIKRLLKNQPLKKESKENLKGSFYALLTALCLQDFGYYIITAKK